MNIDEKDTILMLWTASLDGTMTDQGDWMCTTWLHDGELFGEYRFRYHAGPGFDAPDRISRTGLKAGADSPEKREQLYAAVRAMLKLPGFSNVVETPINGGIREYKAALLEIPGWQIKVTQVPKTER